MLSLVVSRKKTVRMCGHLLEDIFHLVCLLTEGFLGPDFSSLVPSVSTSWQQLPFLVHLLICSQIFTAQNLFKNLFGRLEGWLSS